MLEKDRFLEIKKLANKIRKENEDLFKSLKNESTEDAIKEKEEFMENIIDSMDGIFSDGDNGREERQIFRANVLIPDDDEFLSTYTKDKNIRNLMHLYNVGIEDLMGKITELNVYSDYFEDLGEEDDFVDSMVKLSNDDAESLLDEIESLSNAIEEFSVDVAEDSLDSDISLDSDVSLDSDISLDSEEVTLENLDKAIDEALSDDSSDEMSIDYISEAVDGFVSDFNSIQSDLNSVKAELDSSNKLIEEQKEQIRSLREEAYSLRKGSLESTKILKEVREANESLENENSILREQVKSYEVKIKQSSALLKKIYDSIPKK